MLNMIEDVRQDENTLYWIYIEEIVPFNPCSYPPQRHRL